MKFDWFYSRNNESYDKKRIIIKHFINSNPMNYDTIYTALMSTDKIISMGLSHAVV